MHLSKVYQYEKYLKHLKKNLLPLRIASLSTLESPIHYILQNPLISGSKGGSLQKTTYKYNHFESPLCTALKSPMCTVPKSHIFFSFSKLISKFIRPSVEARIEASFVYILTLRTTHNLLTMTHGDCIALHNRLPPYIKYLAKYGL